MLTTEEVLKRAKESDRKLALRLKLRDSGLLEDGEEIVYDTEKPEENKHNGKEIRVSDLISDNFRVIFKTKKPNIVCKGGRSSLKSSAISIKMVLSFLSDDKSNAICFRKVAKYLSTSVYQQIKWAIYMLGVEDEFTFLKSPMMIMHKDTETAFYFFGVDDPMKIKSAKIAVGYVDQLWFEEAAEFSGVEEIDTVTDTFIRQDLPGDKEVITFFSYNPPRNPYVWINEWLDEVKHDIDYLIHHSTYEEDTKGFLSKQFLRKILRTKERDPDYHDWMYLGKVIGLGNTIYNTSLFNVVQEVPDDDRLIFADVSSDTGYSTSATTFLFIGYTLKGRSILLDTYYYSPVNKARKKAPSDFSKDLNEFVTRNAKEWGLNVDTQVIDSADAALRNQYAKDYGIYLTPAKKKTKEKMIENVEDLMVQDRVYILDTPENEIFLVEHRKYQWDEDTLKKPEPKVVKVDDHTCDAFQYYVNNNLIKLGLK